MMSDFVVHGCRETVFSVTDLDKVARIYTDVGGWRITHRGVAGPGLAAY